MNERGGAAESAIVGNSTRKTPELLAPAGDWDSLHAAVANGADAVYFGLEDFNARRRAENFSLASLSEIIEYLHRHNVKGHVAFNTLIFSDELDRAARFAAAIARAGADAVIVQDLGLARLIHRLAPTLPIHASTQMTQTEPRGAESLRSLGVRRVILARELSLAEIGQVARSTSMELEVFVHGALCVSYSGQCLASESLFGRSANRGECAQACRLPYELVVDGRSAPDPGEDRYPLSTRDLVAYDRIADLARLGVAAVKVEGRLKSAHYVAAATQVYRAALDAAAAGRRFTLSAEQRVNLAQSFSRGFTHGFLDGVDHRQLVQARVPGSRGVRVGTVTGKTRQGVLVELEDRPSARGETPPPLKPGDGVVFDEGLPERDEQGGRVYSVRPVGSPRRVELTFGRGDVNLAAVAIGSAVWKTDDPAVRRRLEGSFRRVRITRRVPLAARVIACVGEPLRIAVRDDAGGEAEVVGDAPLPRAEKHPLTVDLLRQQLGRLGDTPFALASVELVGPEGPAETQPVMVPKSVLNSLRRQVVERLFERRRSGHEIAEPDALGRLRSEVGLTPSPACPTASAPDGALWHPAVPVCNPSSRDRAQAAFVAQGFGLHILVRTVPQLKAALAVAPLSAVCVAGIYVDFADVRSWAPAVADGRAAGVPTALATPVILKPGEDDLLRRIDDLRPDAVLVRNLGALAYFLDHAPGVPLIADYSFNIANEIAAGVLMQRGTARLTPGYDLDAPQLELLLSRAPAEWFEVVIRSHVPMFHTQHCVLASRLTEAGDCPACDHPCTGHEFALRDRVGAEHPVRVDAAGRTTIFRSASSSSPDRLPALRQRGVRHFRIELLRESESEARALLDTATRSLAKWAPTGTESSGMP